MFENYNETELLSLMLNKDEFILYITQQYNNNDCCTPLEPIIWAIHFNIPKFQRQPLLENILLRSIAYIKKCYSFLPDKQILGKTYEVLGIPTVCGEPNKCFLNAYKKYKPYYPVRYPKNEKTRLLCNVVHHSIEINTSTKYSNRKSTTSLFDLEIICSTPNTKQVHSFEVNPLLSPIKTQIKEKSIIWPTDSFYDGNNILSIQNITQNDIVSDTKQIVTLPRILEQSGIDILNNSQQILSSLENGDISKMNNSNKTQSEIHFISRDPKYFSYDNDISESNMSSLSSMYCKESYDMKENKCSNRNTTSIYFEDSLKKIEYKVSDLKKPSILIKKKKNSVVLKQNLSEKLKKNSSLLKMNIWSRKSITSPSINIKTSNPKQIKQNSQKSTLEPWTRINETFNDISFSDSDKTSQTQKIITKHNQDKNMHHIETEHVSIKSEHSDTQNSWIVEPQNSNREEDSILSVNSSSIESEHDSIKSEYINTQNSWIVEPQNSNREEDSISSVNSSPKVYNKLNYHENHKMYKPSTSNSSLLTFSDTSVLNSTINSHKPVSIEQNFINWSQDISNANGYKENNTTQNNDNVVNNSTLSEGMQWSSQENITINFSSANNTVLSSTTNTLVYISNSEENSE